MNVDATFWVAVSFFVFLAALIYLKIPQKMNISLNSKISEIKKELDEAEKLKEEAKILLSDYERKIDKSTKESKEIIYAAKNESEKNIIETTRKFHQITEERKKSIEQKIIQMKESALKDVKKISVKIAMGAVTNLIENSIDKKKLKTSTLKAWSKRKLH